MHSMLVKKDRIIINDEQQVIKVLNEFGNPILYAEALNDMVELEEELLKLGSHYINQHEISQASKDIESGPGQGAISLPDTMIDRAQMTYDLYEKELQFQFKKVLLIEQALEANENVCDPLDSTRVIQLIVDTMA